MAITLNRADRDYLEQLAFAKMRPTRRQKAKVLLGLAAGENLDSISMRVGVAKDELSVFVDQYVAGGLEGAGLTPRKHQASNGSGRRRDTTVVKTPNVCGGDARLVGTRIPVWQLVEARDLGVTESQIMMDFPRLTAANLVDAWAYAEAHPEEIADSIHLNEVS